MENKEKSDDILSVIDAIVQLPLLETLVSNNCNNVVMVEGKADTIVDLATDSITYKFVQNNSNYPKATRVSVANFMINDVALTTLSKTFSYKVDSSAIITLTINIANIRARMLNDVEHISFNLIFDNKESKTTYYVGPFTIGFNSYKYRN